MLRKNPFITGEYYHVYNRGIDKRIIFQDQHDYERFIMLLFISNSQENLKLNNILRQESRGFVDLLNIKKGESLVSIGAWCLMPNHFHILLKQDIDGGISKFMKKLGTSYSMFFNLRYDRQGALFGGPFKSKCIKNDDNYMRHLFAYIHLNPLDIKFPDWSKALNEDNLKMKLFLNSYQYSSYNDYINPGRIHRNILNTGSFPDYFHPGQSLQLFVENYFSLSQDSPCLEVFHSKEIKL